MIQGVTGIVVMGASGSGKSTLGRQLALALNCRFVEGDDLHPAANVAKMARGTALDDEDRWPWLKAVADALNAGEEEVCVLSCSALKRSYRDFVLDCASGAVLFVFPRVDRTTLQHRLDHRSGHYMPPSLLESQLAILELPQPDEVVLELDGTLPVATLVAGVLHYLSTRWPSRDIFAENSGQTSTQIFGRVTTNNIPGTNQ